jgi:Ca2+-binding RTX toxin-like protein
MAIYIQGDYVVGPAEHLVFNSSSDGYILDGQNEYDTGSNKDPTFEDQGSIEFTSSQANAGFAAVGDDGYGFYLDSYVKIDSGASLIVDPTGANSSAYGYYTGSWAGRFENDGFVKISATQTAWGVVLQDIASSDPARGPDFLNTGHFEVSAAQAVGASIGPSGVFENDGDFLVSGPAARGVLIDDPFGRSGFTNTGNLLITGANTTAIALSGGRNSPYLITNDGTISAQTAIAEYVSTSPSMTVAVKLVNQGIIDGQILLGPGPNGYDGFDGYAPGDEIDNAGAINGAIHFDYKGSVYDGNLGTQTGGIYFGDAGGNRAVLGNDGEQAFGGAGTDIIFSGHGDDTLDGGPGVDNASYMYAPSLVHVDLSISGPQDTLGAGKDTLISIENLIGSAFDDQLNGDANANTIQGLDGNDTINGQGGADLLIGEGGADTLTGGAGADTFLYFALSDSTVGAADLITDFTSGDLINLAPIDADPATAGDQAFHLGGGGGHAGDIVVRAYDAVHDRTVIDLYTGSGPIAAEIWLTGNHSGLTASDFVL